MKEVGMFCHGGEMKLDLGCGDKCRAGYIGVDYLDIDGVVKCNLEKDQWCFEDNSVERIFSSHCLEHISNVKFFLGELVRVCKPDAEVEIWTPHWTSPMAMCYGHKVVWSENQWRQIAEEFIDAWFDKSKGYLKLITFMYSKPQEIILPDCAVKYYHDFAFVGKVVK